MINSIREPLQAYRAHTPTNIANQAQKLSCSDYDIDLSSENLSKHIQHALDDFYKKPLPAPSEITVRNLQGQKVKWNSLSYSQQRGIVMHHHKGGCTSLSLPYEGPYYCEKTIPRWTHGLMHATRAALLVRMVANMYNHFHPTIQITEKEIILAQLLAAYHDSARQAEGVDVWDDESAENAYMHLKALGFSDEIALNCMDFLAHKDGQREGKHILSKLVQCADCLDIMRIYGFHGFNDSYLDIFHDLGHIPEFREELTKFRKEYASFIRKTDAPLLRLHLETQSQSYFQDVESLMLSEAQGKADFPLLTKWTAKEVEEPRESLKMVFEANPSSKLEEYYIVKELNKGTHPSYILEDESGALFFFKELSSLEAKVESKASKIAAQVTNNLVPVADPVQLGSKRGVIQKYLNLKTSVFKNKSGFNPAELSFLQQKQLFTHMIGDYFISNYDAHTAQFGIDSKGNVIAFDKGESFAHFNPDNMAYSYVKNQKGFEPSFYWPPLGTDEPTYAIFSRYLKENKTRKEEILLSKEVQEAFKALKASNVEKAVQTLDTVPLEEDTPLKNQSEIRKFRERS